MTAAISDRVRIGIIVIMCLVAACSSTTSSSEAPEATVSGLYGASGDGVMDSIVFTSDGQYWLKTRRCGESTCLEHGRFAFVGKGDARSMVLTDESGAERTVSFAVLSVDPSSTTLTTKSLTDGTSQLGTGGSTALATSDTDLLAPRADKVILDGQPAELVKTAQSLFDCVAKFFPDGDLAGPWVGAGGWSWNRQECEEKAIAKAVKKG